MFLCFFFAQKPPAKEETLISQTTKRRKNRAEPKTSRKKKTILRAKTTFDSFQRVLIHKFVSAAYVDSMLEPVWAANEYFKKINYKVMKMCWISNKCRRVECGRVMNNLSREFLNYVTIRSSCGLVEGWAEP